jgi:hypothetical protein
MAKKNFFGGLVDYYSNDRNWFLLNGGLYSGIKKLSKGDLLISWSELVGIRARS